MNHFQTQGFEIVRKVFTKNEVEAMRKEADILSTREGSACVRHIRSKSKELDLLAVSERLVSLVPKGLTPVRSILFDKTPEENWPVTWHQDLTITVEEKMELEGYGPWSKKDGSVHVQPPVEVLEKMVTIRIHLDDTPKTNGALRVIPKSHKKGKIESREVLSHVDDSEIVCECSAGDVLLMSPLILHSSKRSESPEKRRIVHFEYALHDSLDERLSWHEPSQRARRWCQLRFRAGRPSLCSIGVAHLIVCKRMKSTSELKPKAIKDLKSIPPKERERIVTRIERMEEDLQGDVKKLTNHTPGIPDALWKLPSVIAQRSESCGGRCTDDPPQRYPS